MAASRGACSARSDRIRVLAAGVALLCGASPALASDGAREISQTCVFTGCFPGDSPGFPVTIDSPGAYVLTSDLETEDRAGIVSFAHSVEIDMAGFGIRGTAECQGEGPTLSCPDVGVGAPAGVRVNFGDGFALRNGFIRGVPGTGLLHAAGGLEKRGCLVEGMQLIGNADDGAALGAGCVMRNSVVSLNGDKGVVAVDGATVLEGVSALGNGNVGIQLLGDGSSVSRSATARNGNLGFDLQGGADFGPGNDAGEESRCDGGLCVTGRRFYLTTEAVGGDAVLSACADGFHAASLWEILDPSGLVYDPVLGNGTRGSSPLSNVFGWIRTGSSPTSVTNQPGTDNCEHYSSSTGFGTQAALAARWVLPEESQRFGFWNVATGACNNPQAVWCVED